MPDKKKKEPTKDWKKDLREMSADEFEIYVDMYPRNIHVRGEQERRKNKKLKERNTTMR